MNDVRVGSIYRKDTHIPIVGIVVSLASSGFFYGQEIWNAGASAEYHSRVCRAVGQCVFMRDIVEVPEHHAGPMADVVARVVHGGVDHVVDAADPFVSEEETRG